LKTLEHIADSKRGNHLRHFVTDCLTVAAQQVLVWRVAPHGFSGIVPTLDFDTRQVAGCDAKGFFPRPATIPTMP
jgi:hypothetical protein